MRGETVESEEEEGLRRVGDTDCCGLALGYRDAGAWGGW